MKYTFLLLILFTVLLTAQLAVFAQSDAAKFAEGRVAFDKFKDCPTAIKAFEEVSAQGRKEPLWIFYMAKAKECVGSVEDALSYYEKYDSLVPGQNEILEKIGELRYLVRKKKETEQAKQQAKLDSSKRVQKLKWIKKGVATTSNDAINVVKYQYILPDYKSDPTVVCRVNNSGLYWLGELQNWSNGECDVHPSALPGNISRDDYEYLATSDPNAGSWQPYDPANIKNYSPLLTNREILAYGYVIGEMFGKKIYLCASNIHIGYYIEGEKYCMTDLQYPFSSEEEFIKVKNQHPMKWFWERSGNWFSIFVP